MSTTPSLDKMRSLLKDGKLTVDNMVNTLSYVQVYIIHTASYNGTLKGYVDNKTASYAVDLVNASIIAQIKTKRMGMPKL